jgi:hypothetical protein
MLFNQRARLGQHHWTYLALHVHGVPCVELLARMSRQGFELELQKSKDIQRAGLVIVEKLLIACPMQFAVERADLDQEFRPLEIAVPAQQGVVEIKHYQLQSISPSGGNIESRGVSWNPAAIATVATLNPFV